ncbi:Cell division cycle protein 27-like protein B [Raphanus sativus]|uniref:Cell division cycle protein 27 homolog B n=1 Tax=Raphanus sativus TaxID=3726 RepID=A0A6J0K1U9_RAPSA|nr:cell division cycle protein 27 homolog B [Raphanus sativus]KAJ4888898.1 Cell division cycle protein 27-like protein B [Raphanus sativus]
MEAMLVDCVRNSLSHFVYKNAIFMCERLCAEFPSEVNLQLLATSYLQNNQAYSAYHLLKGTQMAQSRYLFALSCYQMDLLNEAESSLCPVNEPGAEIPNGAAGHYLLGLIYKYTDRRKNAAQQFKQALTLDPLLWAAYEELCILGAAEEATAVFGETAALSIQKQYMQQMQTSIGLNTYNEERNTTSAKTTSSEDYSPRQPKHTQGHGLKDISGNFHSHGLNGGVSNMTFYNTPSPVAAQLSGMAPPPLFRNFQPAVSNQNSLTTDNSPKSTVNSTIQAPAPRRKFVDEGKLRKISGRLFSDSGPRRSSRLSADLGANTNASVATVSGNGNNTSKYLGSSKLSSLGLRSVTLRKGNSWANENMDEGVRSESFDDSRPNTASTTASMASSDAKSCDQEDEIMSQKITIGVSEILSLLRTLGEGCRLSYMYKCQEALDTYMKLPHKHYNTGWVLSQVGKAYFELIDYLEAEKAFRLARQASPYSLEGMDIYSTVLYHLKEDMKLSYLAQELISTDRLAPQSWCAMGNCYSLQKDHETALKNFLRAVQLNPRFAYAHTLCGHEYATLEDFENGMKSYQNALRVDTRHYNAWYGLGMIYLRQEKLEFSEHHFRMAFLINPSSSVIMSYLGTALHALKRSEEALEIMEHAILADRKNPLPMYQKANILVCLERLDEALEVLEELKEYAPSESSVYALMGRIYKRRNMHDKAMLHFGLALDMKPPATDVAAIKAAMEKLHVPDEIDESP